jgi:hypothetical protein
MKKRRSSSLARNDAVIPGIGWYSPDQYARLREVSEDRNGMYDTWAEWEANARKTLNRLRAEGVPAREVPIDVEAMIAWCSARGQSINGSSRTEYIVEMLRNMPPQPDDRSNRV